jgi:HD-like signal output (HDOD) protein
MSSAEASSERTLLRRAIAEIRTKGDFPAVARVIEKLRASVAREHCAALDIARIVLQDAGFASKLLRLVNSAFYRRHGEPVSTVTRAVLMVGFEVRSFVAAPLVVRDQAIGVIVATRSGERPLTAADQALVDLLCDQAAVAFHHAAG